MHKSILILTFLCAAMLGFAACSSSTGPTGPNAKLVAPSMIDFGRVRVGMHRDTSIRFTNTGTDSLAITNQIFASASFSLVDSAQRAIKIGPGGYQDIAIRFAPTDSNSISSADSIVTNVGSYSIALHGGGIAIVRHLVTVAAIDFGNTRIGLCQDSLLGARRDTLIAVHNTGNDTLRVVSASGADAFFSSSFTQTIAPGDSGWLRVDYCPRSTGALRGMLTILSNATDDSIYQIALSGTGVAYLPAPGSIFNTLVYSLDSNRNATLRGLVPDTIVSNNSSYAGLTGVTQVGTSNPTYYKLAPGGDVMFYSNGVPVGQQQYFGSGWWMLPTGSHTKNVTLFTGDTMLGAVSLHVEEIATYVKDTNIMISGVSFVASEIQVVKLAKYGPVTQPNHIEYIGLVFVPDFGYMAGVEYYMQSEALKTKTGAIRFVTGFNLR